MGILKYTISCVIFFGLSNCSNTEEPNQLTNYHWGYANISLNENIFKYEPYAVITAWHDSTFTLFIDGRNSNKELRESFSIFNIPKRIGHNQVTSGKLIHETVEVGASLSTYLDDGDVTGDIFRYDTILGKAYVDVTYWDSSFGHIKGTYDVKVFRGTHYIQNSPYPDTLHLQGDFLTKLIGK